MAVTNIEGGGGNMKLKNIDMTMVSFAIFLATFPIWYVQILIPLI